MGAVDLKPGKVIWQTPMVPKGYTGGALWSSTPAIDPTRGVVYITTGNNYTTPKEVAECQESGKRDCLPIDDHIDFFWRSILKREPSSGRPVSCRLTPGRQLLRQRARAWHLPNRAAAISTLVKAHPVYRDRLLARPATSLPPDRRAACSGE